MDEDDLHAMESCFFQAMDGAMEIEECDSFDIEPDEESPIEIETEVVKCCPHCEAENTYHNYDVRKEGYVVKCKKCGREIFLCDECFHNEDNPSRKCDWTDGEMFSICFRGKCLNSGEGSSSERYRCDIQTSIEGENQTSPFEVTSFAETIEEAQTEAFKALSKETAKFVLCLSAAKISGKISFYNCKDNTCANSEAFDGVVKNGRIILNY